MDLWLFIASFLYFSHGFNILVKNLYTYK